MEITGSLFSFSSVIFFFFIGFFRG